MRSTESETVCFDGGACKSLDAKGKVGGYLVLFGSPQATDASKFRDYFTKDTDFGLDLSTRSRVLYHHGLNKEVGAKALGTGGGGSLKADEVGIWMEAQLDLRDKYEAAIDGMVKAGRLGLSSGTASHLIRREKQADGSNKVLSWPLGLDASLTPAPAEPRTSAVAIKSLGDGSLKGEYLGEMSEPAAAMAAVRSLQELLCCSLWRTLGDEELAPADRMARIGGAFDEFRDTCLKMIAPLLMGDEDAGARKGAADLEDLRLYDQYLATCARLHGAPT